MTQPETSRQIVEFPAPRSPVDLALDQLEFVYAFIYARVGNRPDAEDLTQQVALKSLSRLRSDAGATSIKAYLFATARSVLADFWTGKLGVPEQELDEKLELQHAPEPANESALGRVERILARLPSNYRRVLELRFLRGYSLKDAASEMQTTPGNIKVMQLRALRSAAQVDEDA